MPRNLLYSLPLEIQNIVYSFDSTYREVFYKVLHNIRLTPNLFFVRYQRYRLDNWNFSNMSPVDIILLDNSMRVINEYYHYTQQETTLSRILYEYNLNPISLQPHTITHIIGGSQTEKKEKKKPKLVWKTREKSEKRRLKNNHYKIKNVNTKRRRNFSR